MKKTSSNDQEQRKRSETYQQLLSPTQLSKDQTPKAEINPKLIKELIISVDDFKKALQSNFKAAKGMLEANLVDFPYNFVYAYLFLFNILLEKIVQKESEILELLNLVSGFFEKINFKCKPERQSEIKELINFDSFQAILPEVIAYCSNNKVKLEARAALWKGLKFLFAQNEDKKLIFQLMEQQQLKSPVKQLQVLLLCIITLEFDKNDLAAMVKTVKDKKFSVDSELSALLLQLNQNKESFGKKFEENILPVLKELGLTQQEHDLKSLDLSTLDINEEQEGNRRQEIELP